MQSNDKAASTSPKVYVASSWRNMMQQAVVHVLRNYGCEVYDFRNPAPVSEGFRWTDIDPDWKLWTPAQHRKQLDHPIAQEGFARDMRALEECDLCVIVLPCGRSAHLEAGYAIGAGKPTAFLIMEQQEPELMYKMGSAILTDFGELLEWYDLQKSVLKP